MCASVEPAGINGFQPRRLIACSANLLVEIHHTCKCFFFRVSRHRRGGGCEGWQEEPERGHFVLTRQGEGEGDVGAEGEAEEGMAGGPGEDKK